MPAKGLHARRVAQIESKNFQPMPPLGEIRLGRITGRCVAREACADDELHPGAQQLDARLITDLHAPAGQERHAPAQIRRLGALAEIQIAARRAKLVVEMMNRRVVLLADVAILRLDDFAEIRVALNILLRELDERNQIRRGEDFFPAQLANPGFIEFGLVPLNFLRFALAHFGLHQPPPGVYVRAVNLTRRLEQTHSFLLRKPGEQRAVCRRLFENLGGRFQLRGRRMVFLRSAGFAVVGNRH